MTLRPIVKRISNQTRQLQKLSAHELPSVVLTNRTGSAVAPGDVVVIDPYEALCVRWANAVGMACPLVVLTEGADGETIKCASRGYGPVDITCDSGAVAIGDVLVSSSTPRLGHVDNSATIRTFLGIALTTKGSGYSGIVTVLL